MTAIPIYQVAAFAENLFEGNPAAICPLQTWLPDQTMQQIAAENNLSETAFFVLAGETPHLRWFTPTTEVDFCGHATLAAGHIVLTKLDQARQKITFNTRRGLLSVERTGNFYQLNFPEEENIACDIAPELVEALGAPPSETHLGPHLMAVYQNQAQIEALQPDWEKLKSFCAKTNIGIIVTAPADAPEFDFISRFFAPAHGIHEDPTTGSAHCQLTPYWVARLGKETLAACQISRQFDGWRIGRMHCTFKAARILLQARCVDYMVGEIYL